jgi:hypothetical protein
MAKNSWLEKKIFATVAGAEWTTAAYSASKKCERR